VEFRLLGPIEAVRDDRSLPLGGAKQRGLLALLLLHANEVVSRDRLIDELWPEREPGTAGHSLDVQVSRLRKAFEPEELLVTRGGGYVLEVDPEQIDSHRFERLLEIGRKANAAGQPRKALEALEAALALWRGGALADLAYEPFARSEIDRLEELRLVATEERIEAELALGSHGTLVPELESLIAAHPHRERLRGQLMLALYRSGRQAEALRVYADTRKRLVDELGIEPGQPLRDLEQTILRQDPGLDLPRAPAARRRRRAVVGTSAVMVAGALAAGVVLLTQGGTGSAKALASPDTNVFLRAGTGRLVRQIPMRNTIAVRYGEGSLWSLSADGELTRVDPRAGKVQSTLGLGIRPSGLAIGEGFVWVTDGNSPTLVQIDPRSDVPANHFPLPQAGTNQTSSVLVAAGSVWVGHGGLNPGAYVERIDPETGKVLHQFGILGGEATSLAYADGAVWVASAPAGELRKIDVRTNSIALPTIHLRQKTCCVAAGGGYVWAGVNPDHTIWKLGEDGKLLKTLQLPARIASLTYADGALWVAEGEGGTVVRIDPTSDRKRTYTIAHDVSDLALDRGLLAVGVQQTEQDATVGLGHNVVYIGRADDTLFRSGAATDPALIASWDDEQLQFHYATCAKLYNFPDVEGDAGKTVVPEVAAGFPVLSDGGRTATIRVRRGYEFSPPSDEPVTAESFRRAFERDVSPLHPWFDPNFDVLVGAHAFYERKASRISGVTVRGDTLVLQLRQPVPDLPRALALSLFCAVPETTPVTPFGITTPIASAGPYYLAANTPSVAVLKRNPNYPGPRPQKLDAIVYEFGIPPAEAAQRISKGTLDYVLERDESLAPSTSVARTAGPRYRLTPDSTASTQYLAFNTSRPLFKDLDTRRAVQYALDRRALAAVDGAIPSTRLLSPRLVGYDRTALYPLTPDLREARKLMHGRRAHAVFAVFDPSSDPTSAAFARAVRQQLDAIGISVSLLPLYNADYDNDGAGAAAKTRRSDLVWGGGNVDQGDPARYLKSLGHLPPPYSERRARIATLSSPRRDREAAALAAALDKASLFAVYEDGAIPELVSKRLGCIVHQPEFAGVDMAALCLRDVKR
jgi:DNA-binding SARP family transcriptional activator/ABC-type transport system substrate-binding protein